ncbi:MAG: right-handed parallel beta-helix repeat-containing protein [Phycisphaerae bacterium]|nr:right-handed parallel beta-helix repeat-containing protein [Phycisphaerae bacterium]MDD5381639.1 right-handed parallel beta-helix repeat-containing protein [Phycisphaerae bacterium]
MSFGRMNKKTLYHVVYVFICIMLGTLPAAAQPSGGPYGPIKQKYDLPKVDGKIYYVAPDGKAEETGETLEKPTTIEAAIERVVSGDAIVMRGGIYRTGELVLNQGITIQPYEDELPIFKGTFVAKEWENLHNGLWCTSWDRLFPEKPLDWWKRKRHGKGTPLDRFNNDMVFVDGKFLQSVGWEGNIDANSYTIDYEAKVVYIGVEPNDHTIEITAFNGGLTRTTKECHGKKSDGKGPVIRGITFTQYARLAMEVAGTEPEALSAESNHGKEVTGTTLENCEISFCSRVAAYLRGDGLTIRHCKVSDTSTEGIYIIASSDVLLEKNIFTRNNIENITGYFPAAVKIFNQSYRVTCRDNLIIDLPNSNGIWYDVGEVDGVFVDNWVEGVGKVEGRVMGERWYPSDSGFFFEISKGVIVAGNVFVNCDQGIRVLNSCDAQVYNNTLVNSTVFFGRTSRGIAETTYGWDHPSTGPAVDERDGHVFVNNLMTADENHRGPLLVFWQPANLCERFNKPQVNQLDYNVYVRASDKVEPLILWSPAADVNCQTKLGSPEGMQKLHAEFSAHSKYFPGYSGSLFKGPELGNYQLLKGFPGAMTATSLPAEIEKLLGRGKDSQFTGAYPPQ